MKKVLIVFAPVSQQHLVAEISKRCSNEDLKIDGFCSGNWKYIDNKIDLPFYLCLFRFFISIRKVGTLFQKLLLTLLLNHISKHYDLIDITFFIKDYYPFAKSLIHNKKNYKITFWGSDFYRASKKDLDKKLPYLLNAKCVQVETPQIMRDVLSQYPQIKNKMQICNYGIKLFDIIDEYRYSYLSHALCDTKGKIVLTCGYNGSKGQQHEKMISAIERLPIAVKNQLFLFFPMTYGVPSKEYLYDIRKKLTQLGIAYHIFEDRLTEMQLAILRLQSDIVLNVQVTDAFSSSLIEHLYASGILVCGDWLPYSIFDDYGIHYYKSKIDDMPNVINLIVTHYSKERDKAGGNIPAVHRLSSWQEITPKLRQIFRSSI